MRFIVVAFCFLILSSSAFAQVRDLFAEFNEEAKTADSVAVSSSAEISSSAVAVSSAEQSPSSAVVSSSSVAVSFSSVALSSSISSSAVSSSSISSSAMSSAMSSSSAISSSSLSLSSSAEISSSSFFSSSSLVADSSQTVALDSTAADSLSQAAADSAAAQAKADSLLVDSLAPMLADSLADTLKTDSTALSSSSVSSSSSVIAMSSSSISRKDILGPTKVSKVYSIDEMKGKYKSPRKALFMSLVVPGAGQIYVGGSTFNYVRGAAYLAIEGALWGSWYYFSVHKYDRQVKRYKKFAKNHYSAHTYETKMHDLRNGLDDSDEEEEFVKRYLSNRESYCKSIYGDAATNGCYTGDATTEMVNDKNHVNKVKGDFSLYNSGSFYSTIAGSAYVLGWDDVENETAISALDLGKNDAEVVPLGESENWKTYRSMRSKANDYADMQAWFFGGLILNHIVSALDAAWSAHAHNKVLYEEELSWYDHLHFEGGFVPMNSRSTVNVYFNF